MGNEKKREARRINPFTDFGFKYIFGQESTKDLLIDFINSILEGDRQVSEITFMNTESIPDTIGGKKVVFDILVKDQNGAPFIIEMQLEPCENFLERMLYYACRMVTKQVASSRPYELKPSYLICVTRFAIPGYNRIKHSFSMRDEEGNGLTDKDLLKIIFIQVAKFEKTAEELHTNEERWLYLLKNLEHMEALPKQFDEKHLYDRLMEISKLDRLDPKNAEIYEESLKSYLDLKSAFAYQKNQGLAEGIAEGFEKGIAKGRNEGRAEGILAAAKAMKAKKYSNKDISDCTGLTIEEIARL